MLKNDAIRLNVLTDMNRFLRIEGSWDIFVKGHTENPFLLSGFFREFMRFSQESGWTPMVLVFSIGGRIIGVVPLAIKKKLGIRLAKFLLTPSYFPDFILDDRYQELCIEKAFDFMFRSLHCGVISLTLSAESPTLGKLRRIENSRGMTLRLTPARGHFMLSVNCDWTKYEKSRGRPFRKNVRRTERALDLLGLWTLKRFNQEEGESGILSKVLHVESKSWKEEWRTRRGIDYDPILRILWNGSIQTAKSEPDFKCAVWLLELNGLPIAYTFVPKYKRTAYITKSSYDNRYRRLSPGAYTTNIIIRDIFKDGQTERIDFHTDLPLIRTWTSTCLPRVNVLISRRRVLQVLTTFFANNEPVKHILGSLSGAIPFVGVLVG